MRTKPHRLTFPMQHLGPVQSGSKVATIRFSAVARRVRCGDALALCFGAYHKPTVVQATVVRVEHVELEPELQRAYTLPEHVMSLIEEKRWLEQPVIPDGNTPAALVEALAASGGDFDGVLQEANARDADRCTCIWFTLTQ